MQQGLSLTATAPLSLTALFINLGVGIILSVLLRLHFKHFSSALTNRRDFQHVCPFVLLTTILIITIVKSSLALSLGLVGALSIVRFRTAIKDPEELSYIFLSIAIGLGLGANQRYITIIGFFIIVAIYVLNNFRSKTFKEYNLYLILKSDNSSNINLTEITDILTRYCQMVDMKRFEESNNNSEIVFFIKCNNIHDFNNIKEDLNKIDSKVEISFSDININI